MKDVAFDLDLMVRHFYEGAVKRLPAEEIVSTPSIADFFPEPDPEDLQVARSYTKEIAFKSAIKDAEEQYMDEIRNQDECL